MQRSRQRQPNAPAAMARYRRTRMVKGKLDLIRQPRQRPAPVQKLPRYRARAIILRAKHRMLPKRVVGILHRQRRKLGAQPHCGAPHSSAQGPAAAVQATTRRPQCDAAPAEEHANAPGPSPSSANRCARSGGSRASSNPRPAAAASAAPSLSSLTLSTQSSGRHVSAASISCRGTPSVSGNTVRRLSCRATTSPSAAASAATSSAPASRTASGIV